MGLFGPTRSERLQAAARALAPYGFRLDAEAAPRLRAYEPFRELAAPERYIVAALGSIEGTPVEAYEYEYSGSDHDGGTATYDALVVVVHHPWVRGNASFVPDQKAWGGIAAALDALFWIPPFSFLKAFERLMETANPDLVIGDKEFDRLYKVHAASSEEAARTITPPLREVCLELGFRGAVELRPGTLLYSPYQYRLDATTAVSALGVGTMLLGALAPKHAYR